MCVCVRERPLRGDEESSPSPSRHPAIPRSSRPILCEHIMLHHHYACAAHSSHWAHNATRIVVSARSRVLALWRTYLSSGVSILRRRMCTAESCSVYGRSGGRQLRAQWLMRFGALSISSGGRIAFRAWVLFLSLSECGVLVDQWRPPS